MQREGLGYRTAGAFAEVIDGSPNSLHPKHRESMALLVNLEFQLFDEVVPVLSA